MASRFSIFRETKSTDVAGGGIRLGAQSSMVLLDTELSVNQANTSGGGVFAGGQATIYRATIAGNSAVDGGGVYTNAKCDIQFSLDGNNADRGGGVAITASDCKVRQSAILNNTASVEGGGFHITLCGAALLPATRPRWGAAFMPTARWRCWIM